MDDRPQTVERLASEKNRTLVGELIAFLSTNKKWWLVPILIVLALFAVLAMLGGSGVGPFVYTFF